MRLLSSAQARVLFAAGVLLACDAHANPPVPPAATVQAVDRFRPDAIGFAPGSASHEARRALAREAPDEARRLAEAALPAADTVEAPRLRYLAARACLAMDDAAAAVAHLEAFDAWPHHPLAVWARLDRAHALAALDPRTSLTLATELADVDFPGRDAARRLLARLELARGSEGDVDAALATLRAVAGRASGEALAEVAGPMIERLVARGDEASMREALSLQHALFARAPRTREGRSAERAMVELATRLGEPSLGVPSLDERLAHAEAMSGARLEEAVSAYDAALAAMPEDDARRCATMHGRARAIERGRDKRRVATELVALADACADPEIRGWALFKAGRALAQLDHDDEAIAVYERLESQVPTSRYADDVALLSARLELSRGARAEALARLAATVERYPEGDMRADAFFLLAFSHRDEGRLEEALAILRRSRLAIPREPGEENAGRAAYWEARTAKDLGRVDEAIAGYEALARALPLTYYGISAVSRLRELDAARADAVVAEIRAAADRPTELPLPHAIDRVGLSRATELLVVGAETRAEDEFRRLGLLGDGADDAGLWLAASLYVETDHPDEAVNLVRRRLAEHRASGARGLARAELRIGYPRAFAPLIEEAAQPLALPPSFVRAIAREESSFNPTVVSRANAFGLIQILVPTARGYARDVGIEPNADNLRDPRTNLAFGTRYMARLFQRYATNPALVPAAYNAGHGSVERWLRQDRERPFDVFVEEIPYEETRKYTRRVLQTYGVYSLLDDGTLPNFSADLPPG